MKAAKDMNWALVLSGGGAKGFAHVGVLKALSGMGFPEPSLVVGTSMGAIIGGIYASGMAAEELARIAETRFNITDYLDSFAFKINGPVGRVFQAGQLLGSVVTKPALDPGSKLLALFRELTGDKSFGELKIPFRCNAVDLISGREVVLGEGKVAEAIRASMSFPIFFEPFRTEKMLLVDGGFVDNMPVHIAREMGFRRVLAVDVGAFRTLPASEFVTAPQIVYRCLEISLNSLARSRQEFKPSLLINAGSRSTPLDFNRKLELMKLGEEAAERNRKALKAFFRRPLFALRRKTVP